MSPRRKAPKTESADFGKFNVMTTAMAIRELKSPVSGIPLYPFDDIFEYSPFRAKCYLRNRSR